MNERGRRLDECLDILDAFWTTNPVEYHGRFWTIPATYADLKPVTPGSARPARQPAASGPTGKPPRTPPSAPPRWLPGR
jgi:alkanesulfonate monooxygenase SsuD/methylene tetrahydromethanopterin reductase-like flavin-dependent oxidoreductase (luciferase family)